MGARMSGISLHSYLSVARENLGDGEVRLAKGSDSQLVNKGTAWEKFKSLFNGADSTRADRNRDAIMGFKQAMVDHFGSTAGLQALGTANLLAGGVLTGRAILAAVQEGNRLKNTVMEQRVAAQAQAYGPGQPDFARIAALNLPAVDPATNFPPVAQMEFRNRLADRLWVESRGATQEIPAADVERFARATLKEVARLNASGTLAQSHAARTALTGAYKEALKACADGRGSPAVIGRLTTLTTRADQVLAIDDPLGGPPDKERIRAMALRQAMRELNAESPGILAKAHANIAKPDSPLRGVMVAAREYVGDEMAGWVEHHQGDVGERSGGQVTFANALSEGAEEIVNGLARRHAALLGGSPAGEVAHMRDAARLEAGAGARGREAVLAAAGRVPVGKAVGHEFLREVQRDFRVTADPSLAPPWDSPDLLRRMERAVNFHCERDHVEPADGIRNFREAVLEAPLDRDMRDKLLAGLDAMASERRLWPDMEQSNSPFRGLRIEDRWRMASPGVPGGVEKWEAEHRAEGALGAAQRSFDAMINSCVGRTPFVARPLGSALIGDIHRAGAGPEGQSLRTGAVSTVIPATSLTPAGRAELEAMHAADQTRPDTAQWFAAAPADAAGGFRLDYRAKPTADVGGRADAILARYRADITALPAPQTPAARLEVVGRAFQELVRARVVEDDDTNTMSAVLNRMLVDNGLGAAMVTNPGAAIGCSGAEFVQQIRDGQARFQGMRIT
jgi:hypothetical protein